MTTITVRQEVAAILKTQAASYLNASHVLDGEVRDFYQQVSEALSQIHATYVTPEPEPEPEPEPVDTAYFHVGDRVRLTGSDWQKTFHGVRRGDIATVTEVVEDQLAKFSATALDGYPTWWWVYGPDADGDEYSRWGGEVIPADEIVVGDTVRINAEYKRVDAKLIGKEFVVTAVSPSHFEHGGDGNVSEFYVDGDPKGRGIWAAYIERVSK